MIMKQQLTQSCLYGTNLLSQMFTVMIKATEKNDLKELEQFLNGQKVQDHISEFCTTQHIEVPEKLSSSLWRTLGISSKEYEIPM